MENKGYIFINLLPYREKIRKEKTKQFSLFMALFALAGGAVIFMLSSFINMEIDAQKSRNDFIQKENTKLDNDIKSIAQLKDQIKETLAKRKVVENLQVNRSDAVSLLNEISNQLPEGVTLKSVNQVDDKVTIVGNTQSNNKVSNYMTNLASTTFFMNPELVEIKAVQVAAKKQNAKVGDDQNISEFTMNVYLKNKPDTDEDKKDLKKTNNK